MYLIDPHAHSRRAFLRRSARLALAGTALPTALNLAAIGEAAAFNASDPYKALVCVFLYGGNDYANTVVSYDDATYDKYSLIRGGGPGRTAGGIALAKAALTPTLLVPDAANALPGGREYALHPSMTKLAALFNSQQSPVAVQLNVGPLVAPITKAQYQGNNRTLYPLPPKLFSHNDQQSTWQSSSPEGSTIGWGGNAGDLAMASNTNSLFTCISVTGNAVFLAGDSALSYQVSTAGAVKINSTSNDWTYNSSFIKQAMQTLTQQPRANLLENEYNVVTKRAIASESTITTGLATGVAVGTGTEFQELNALSNNPLASQLKMVARLIAAQATTGAKRQVFMVSLGGFDLHDNLMTNHVTNMTRVSDALDAFYKATVSLKVDQYVTAFTASDFGRTLTSNGDGSDHGWGNHHFVVGGAVNGKRFYGKAPGMGAGNTTGPDDMDHVGQGRLLPTTSVDQYAATLATWFGVEASEMAGVLPNISRFGGTTGYPVNLGFMK
jgi:uncharacterized protein (DUF1501 family)